MTRFLTIALIFVLSLTSRVLLAFTWLLITAVAALAAVFVMVITFTVVPSWKVAQACWSQAQLRRGQS